MPSPASSSPSFLNTIPEDQSDGTGSSAPTGLRRGPHARSPRSVSAGSVDSSTGAVDSVTGRLSAVSTTRHAILAGGDSEMLVDEYDDDDNVELGTPSVLADAGGGGKRDKHHRPNKNNNNNNNKILSFCTQLMKVTRRNGIVAIAIVVLAAVVLSAIVAVVTINNRQDASAVDDDARPPLPNATAPPAISIYSEYLTSVVLNQTKHFNTSVWSDAAAPATRARDWMVYNDTLRDEIVPQGEARIRQRFALAYLWFATTTAGATSWTISAKDKNENSSAVLEFLNPLTNECTWTGVTCGFMASSSDMTETKNISSIDEDRKNHIFALHLGSMNLIGSVPTELGTCIPSLLELDLSSNFLTGTLSDNMFDGGWQSTLNWLDVSGNNLTGTIPPAVWSMDALQFLFLYKNQFTGSIQRREQQQNISTSDDAGSRQGDFLAQVFIERNQFTGSLPTWFTALADLKQWIAHHNQFTGPLPDPPLNLEYFDMSYNQLSGSIPNTFWSEFTSPGIKVLYLDNNKLSGPLPNATIQRQLLEILWLNNNSLTDEIPNGFAQDWMHLQSLQLHGNDLTGTLGLSIANPEDTTALANECLLAWPRKNDIFTSDCNETYHDDPVQCDCCDECF